MSSLTKDDCVFCKIGAREIGALIVYEDGELIGFRDINPQAPTHILIVPKAHWGTVNDFTDTEAELLGKMVLAAQKIARQEKVSQGYRLVLNCGRQAGQSVFHVHLHLLGGRTFTWPPG